MSDSHGSAKSQYGRILGAGAWLAAIALVAGLALESSSADMSGSGVVAVIPDQARALLAEPTAFVGAAARGSKYGRLRSGLPPGGRMFSANSPFNTPILGQPAIHSESEELVQTLVKRTKKQGAVVAVGEWTVPVYQARRNTPRQKVKLTESWSPFRRVVGVPIPKKARPDPQEDGHLAIIDPAGDWLWEFWQARKTRRGWKASWGTRISLNSTGVHPSGMSARGSGFALTSGLIWPGELTSGRIDHALVFSTLPTKRNTFVAPATESDGRGRGPHTLPEGARLQLDPRLDLNSLKLSRNERTIATALQRYGMILSDNGSRSISFYQISPQSFRKSVPNRRSWKLYDGVAELSGIPWNRMRVLSYGGTEQKVDTDALRVTDRSIYRGWLGY
jgi:hypothetical protein